MSSSGPLYRELLTVGLSIDGKFKVLCSLCERMGSWRALEELLQQICTMSVDLHFKVRHWWTFLDERLLNEVAG